MPRFRSQTALAAVVGLVVLLCPAPPVRAGDPPPEGAILGFESPRRGRGGLGGRGIEWLLERHGERLGLDDATRARIREIAAEGRAEGEATRLRLDELRRDLRALLERESPDEAEVMRYADLIGAAETELRKLRLRTLLRIRALLTPEQRRELIRIHRERDGRGRRPRG